MQKDVADVQPYAFDTDRQAFVFVSASYEAVDKSSRAFFYQGQRDVATRVFLIPAAQVDELAEKLINAQKDAVALDKVLLVQSTGRCGSTLLSRLLSTISGVYSLSEPDVFSSLLFGHSCQPDNLPRPALLKHLRSAAILLVRSTRAFRQQPNEHIALKFRSFATLYSDAFRESIPEAKVCRGPQ